MSEKRPRSPAPRQGVSASSKLRGSIDAQLIAAVRARRLLYDATHPRYADNSLKVDVWKKIGEELQADPVACKARWTNIRDNYRKSRRRRRAAQREYTHKYKYSHMLAFMNKFFKGQDDLSDTEDLNDTDAADSEDIGEETIEYIEEEFENDVNDDETEETIKTVGFPAVKVDSTIEKPESLVDYEYFEKRGSASTAPTFPVHPATMHAVDAFLAGLSPTLKAMAPIHLSLAKAEIYQVVHKYEMKGLVEGGREWPRDVNPLV